MSKIDDSIDLLLEMIETRLKNSGILSTQEMREIATTLGILKDKETK